MERPALLAELERRAAAFDPTRSWVRPGGATLSDRVWQGGQGVRRQIDDLLREAIRTGEDALVTADKLEQFLDPSLARRRDGNGRLRRGQARRIVTRSPGRGGMGSFPARRLARTEVSRAHAEATEAAGALNPFARGLRWNLSGRHVKGDECDGFATRDVGLGSGVYPFDRLPRLPAHSACLCYWTQEATEDAVAVVSILRARYQLGPRPQDQAPATPARRSALAAAAQRVARAISSAVGFEREAA